MKPHVVAFVFARGGSKSLPRKNLRLLAGKPLIAHAITAARSSALVDRVVVSTDDEEIAAVARAHGGEVPFLRPAELATDSAPEWLAWRHAIHAVQDAPGARAIDIFVCVPATAPLRASEDVDRCIRLLIERKDTDVVFTVSRAHGNPWFNMIVFDADGLAHLAVPPVGGPLHRRQDAPSVYDITPIAYATRPRFVLERDGLFAGRARAVEVPPERAIDIDTELDFAIAECLFARAAAERRGSESRGYR